MASSSRPLDVLSRVQAWLDGTRDLEARFEQTLESGALGVGTTETGRLLVERPGRIRWEYTHPERKIALLLGNRTLLYLPEDRQLIRGTIEEGQGLLPEVLAGRGRLADLFEVSLAGAPSGDGVHRLRLIPRQHPEGIEEVNLTVDAKTYEIEGAEVLDGSGNRTSYRFRGIRRNRGLDPRLFQLEPPPGTSILEQ